MKSLKEFKSDFNNIVIFGYSENFINLLKINKNNKIKTIIITTPENKKKINFKSSVIFTKNFDNKVINQLKRKIDFKKTLFISLGSRWIFNNNQIKEFDYQLINIHSSMLPFDKGGGGYSWRILRNDRIYSSTIHLVSDKIDEGMIIDQDFDLFPDTAKIPKDYIEFTNKKFIKQYLNFITNLKKGKKFTMIKNPDLFGDYYPRLNTKINGWINWSWKPIELERFINAFDEPYEGAKTFLYDEEVYLTDVRLSSFFKHNHSFVNGIVTNKFKNFIIVQCGEGSSLLIKSVKNTKGLNINKKIKLGDRFYTPEKKLDLSKKRVFYS
ncbi:formyltransferase family protein [Candidatus Pelagibacter sp.]|nr:formyltransferase family protein [Candidatus Pelagibacter sp.]